MSKKKKGSKAPKAKTAGKGGNGGKSPRTRAVATKNGGAVEPPVPKGLRDPRLPAVGTVLEKRDRHGSVRCKCTVEEEGIRYDGKVYSSLSSAAVAAGKDLGLTNKTQNLWCGPSYVELAA